MTRWLLIAILLLNPMQSLSYAQDGFKQVPKCTGVQTGYVTFLITPNGGVNFYLSDRPMPQVTSTANLTCGFELDRAVKLLEDA